MITTESGSNYQNRHSRSIHLDTYRGVGCNVMELSLPVADGFMRVSDMRSDVVIIQEPQGRVRDYDEIGFVKVAKLLNLPRLDFWKDRKGLTQTRKEDGVWYIAVNDQDLADRVTHAKRDDRKSDERFADAFKAEVQHGLVNCLRREKLLNGGGYNLGFYVGYLALITYNPRFSLYLASGLINRDMDTVVQGLVAAAALHTGTNVLNLIGAGMTHFEEKFSNTRFRPNTPHFNDPFVKHSLLELLMPPVPIDRLVRGLRYLKKYGNELITYGK